MPRQSRLCRFPAVCLLLPLLLVNAAAARCDDLSFLKDVRPILARNCFACHGPDDAAREADLRLDDVASATTAVDREPAIVPRDPEASGIIVRVLSSDPDLKMPPPDSGHELTAEEIAVLRRWIELGAEYETHWSFVPPQRADVPQIDDGGWCRSDLDRFALQAMTRHQLSPSPPADPWTLVRRVSLDLTGLPPAPEVAARFAADPSDAAWETLVDELLDSPHFGEHWARMWLDLARYADTKGYEKDQPREIWRYRDWVIDALNADMPFDQFTLEQLAGDLLPKPASSQILATAFHRNTLTNDEGGTDNEEFRTLAVKDRVDTTVQVWMGLTMGCAKCHSHKYDPVSQKEYYQFYAFFNQTQDEDRPDDAPRVPTPTADQQRALRELDRQIAAAEQPDAPESARAALEELRKQRKELDAQIPRTPVMKERAADQQRKTFIHLRGNFLEPGDPVSPALPAAFGSIPESGPLNRLAVARWLLSEQNPLTARVMANRIWARMFGTGIVETEEDFGTQGALPSHLELLDWLSLQFRETHQWSLKRLCRSLVLSATYRQSSVINRQVREQDPSNRWLSRGPRFRLPAEAIRDQALFAAGLLSPRVGGPSVMPPQPDGIWRTTYSALKWETPPNEDRYRRGIYTFLRRTSPYPSMITFDAGSREVCLIRRIRTNTPLQALVTMNDPVFVEAAGALAMDVSESADPLTDMFVRILVRPPAAEERARIGRLLSEVEAQFAASPGSAGDLLNAANVNSLPPDSQATRLAALTTVASALLNLDETVTKP